jgi:hypothetical protein
LIERLLDAGLSVIAVHPNQVKAMRPRYSVASGKRVFDNFVLAELARTDSHRFLVLVPDSGRTKALRAMTPRATAWSWPSPFRGRVFEGFERPDYDVLAPASLALPAGVPKECSSSSGAARKAPIKAAAASAKLLADLKSTESAAKAIATTIAREVGAQHAGDRAAASRQDKHLQALAKVFAARRRTAIAAGNALARLFTKANASLRLNAAQYAQAKSAVLAGLANRGAPSSHVALARRLLHVSSLNVLRTLAR